MYYNTPLQPRERLPFFFFICVYAYIIIYYVLCTLCPRHVVRHEENLDTVLTLSRTIFTVSFLLQLVFPISTAAATTTTTTVLCNPIRCALFFPRLFLSNPFSLSLSLSFHFPSFDQCIFSCIITMFLLPGSLRHRRE